MSETCKECLDSSYLQCKDWRYRFVYGCPREDYKIPKLYGKSLLTPIHDKLEILDSVDKSVRDSYE